MSYRDEQLKRIKAFDPQAELRELYAAHPDDVGVVYPEFAGVLQWQLCEAVTFAELLLAELDDSKRRIEVLEAAVDSALR